MSPPETVVALAAVPATAPAFAAFVPAEVAETEAPIASASEPANKNATSGHAIAAVGKKLGDTVSRPSEAAAMDALAALAPSKGTTAKSGGEAPKPAVAPAAPTANPFAPFPPFQLGPVPNPPAQTSGAAQAGTPQWNAMMQYYAYYSYMLAHGGGVPGPAPCAAAPPGAPRAATSGLPALAPKAAPEPPWRGAGLGPSPGMLPNMGVLPGMGVPSMPIPNMGPHTHMGMLSPAQMQSMAQMAAAAAGMLPPPLISVGANAPRDFGLGKTHKRSRDGSRGNDDGTHTKRGKRRGCSVDEVKTCVNCGCTRTPFWRKERVGGGSLCNACGLYLAKNDEPRPKMLWRRGSGSGESTPEAADTPPPPTVEPSAGGSTTPPPPET